MFLADSQCQLFWHLAIQKISSLYLGEDCIKKFCKSLGEHAKNIIPFEKKKMYLLTIEELKSHQNVTEYYIYGKTFIKKLFKDNTYHKARQHYYYTGKCRGGTEYL